MFGVCGPFDFMNMRYSNQSVDTVGKHVRGLLFVIPFFVNNVWFKGPEWGSGILQAPLKLLIMQKKKEKRKKKG